MEKVTLESEGITDSPQPADLVARLGEALGAAHVAINYYELAPGDQFGFDLHRHLDQEEVFYIQSGTATFKTRDGHVEVAAGELVRFGVGEFQLGRNEGDERVTALAIGGPAESREIEFLRACATCGERTIQQHERVTEGLQIICADCGEPTDTIVFDS